VTISLSPLTAAADHSNTRTPYPTPARSTAGEYDGFEYAGLPVNYRILPIALWHNRFQCTTVADGMYAIPLYRISSSRSRFSASGQAGLL
jgi:hypothetical protein